MSFFADKIKKISDFTLHKREIADFPAEHGGNEPDQFFFLWACAVFSRALAVDSLALR